MIKPRLLIDARLIANRPDAAPVIDRLRARYDVVVDDVCSPDTCLGAAYVICAPPAPVVRGPLVIVFGVSRAPCLEVDSWASIDDAFLRDEAPRVRLERLASRRRWFDRMIARERARDAFGMGI